MSFNIPIMNVQHIYLGNFQKNFYKYSTNIYPYINFTGGKDTDTDVFNRTVEDIEPENIVEEAVTEAENPQKIALRDAKKISGIHCPVCGVKMLSKESYEKLTEDSAQINNSKKLLTLLEKNEEFIPMKYKRILLDSKRIPRRYNLGVKEYTSALAEIAHTNKIKSINNVKNYLTNYSKILPPESIEPLKEFISSFDETTPYSDFKSGLTEILAQLNLSTDEINEIRKNTLKEYALSDIYDELFKNTNLEDCSEGETAQNFIANIFRTSINHMNKIEKYEQKLNDPNNCIIICRDCMAQQSKKVFFRESHQPNLKENIILYLKDISFLNGSNLIDIPQLYVTYVCNRVYALSRHNIDFSRHDINSVTAAQKVMSRHDGFEPILQTKVDIPCAECGTTLLPHATKLKIIEKMKECKTPYDYAELLQKYDKYIGFYSRDFAKIFIDIVENKPYISEQEFLETFSECAKNCLESRISSSLSNCRRAKKFYKRIDYKYLSTFDKAFSNVKQYIADGKFEDFNYTKLQSECFKDVDLSNINIRAISLLQRDLKTISYKHMLAFPDSEKFSANPNKIFDIVYGLFSADTATVDHLTALKQGGKNTKYNMIGLCKACNRLKGAKTVIAWYDQHPFMRVNFPKQLNVIDDMAKNNELEDYDDWAHEIADQMYMLTKGEYDITDQFPLREGY